METGKMKYKDLNVLVNSINNVIGSQETKVQKKLFKLYERLKPTYEDYNKQRDELRLDNAATDEKGVLLMDEKNDYKFNKEGVKKLTKDVEALNDKEFDFKPIEVINANGLEKFAFLENWTTGIAFVKEEEEEL